MKKASKINKFFKIFLQKILETFSITTQKDVRFNLLKGGVTHENDYYIIGRNS